MPASLPQRLVPVAARPERPRSPDLRAGRLRRLVGAFGSYGLLSVVQPQIEMSDAVVAARGRFGPSPSPAAAVAPSGRQFGGVFRSFGRRPGQPPSRIVVVVRPASVELYAALGGLPGRVFAAVVDAAASVLPVTSYASASFIVQQ